MSDTEGWETVEQWVADEPILVDAEKVWLVYEYITGGGGTVVLWEEPDPSAYPDAEAYWLVKHKDVLHPSIKDE